MVTFQTNDNKIHPEAGATIATLPNDHTGTVATLPTEIDLEAGSAGQGAPSATADLDNMTPFQQQLYLLNNQKASGGDADEFKASFDSTGLVVEPGRTAMDRAVTGVKSHGLPGQKRGSLMIDEHHQAEIEAPDYMKNEEVRKTMARRTSIVSTPFPCDPTRTLKLIILLFVCCSK